MKISYLGTCGVAAIKLPLHRSVAEVTAKIITRHTKAQKFVQSLMENTPMQDAEVRKVMTSIGKADGEMEEVKT